MKIAKLLAVLFITTGLFFVSCKEGVKDDTKPMEIEEMTKDQPETHGTLIKEGDITLGTPLDQAMVTSGKAIYELKCQACHKLTEDRLVGPGWKDVTKRREPLWIMNMITNVEIMLETDPEAQKQLELCLVRMPNQNVTKEEARSILEYMRNNDGEK